MLRGVAGSSGAGVYLPLSGGTLTGVLTITDGIVVKWSDLGLSRLAGGVLAVGNGAAADASGQVAASYYRLNTPGSQIAYIAGLATPGVAFVGNGGGTLNFGMTAVATAGLSIISAGVLGIGTGADAAINGGLQVATIALGGATIGGNALAVTGTSLLSGAVTMSAALTYGGVALSAAVTGTGNMVLSAAPSLTGTATFAAMSGTGLLVAASSVTISSVTAASQALITGSATASFGIFFGSGAPSFAAAQGSLYMNSAGSSTATRAYVRQSAAWTNFTTAA